MPSGVCVENIFKVSAFYYWRTMKDFSPQEIKWNFLSIQTFNGRLNLAFQTEISHENCTHLRDTFSSLV